MDEPRTPSLPRSPGVTGRRGHGVQLSWSLISPTTPATTTPFLPTYSDELGSLVKERRGSQSSQGGQRRSALRKTWSTWICGLAVVCLCIAGVSTVLLLGALPPQSSPALPVAITHDDPYDKTKYLKGPPTLSFRDNLKDDVNYITSWVCAGWTNDVIALGNLLYLALLSQRVPILPLFAPSHLPAEASFLPFSAVFDVPRLSAALHMPVLEWGDVKRFNVTGLRAKEWGDWGVYEGTEGEVERLGCWSAWMGSSEEVSVPRWSNNPAAFNLDVSYTPTPYSAKAYTSGDNHVLANRLLKLAFPSGHASALSEPPNPLPSSLTSLEPDQHLLCFDYLYYMSVDVAFEWETDWGPQWRLVGRHMRWERGLERLAEEYLKRHFGVAEEEAVPPFISAHIRRADFMNFCAGHNDTCLPTLADVRAKVREVQSALASRKGIVTDRVLITSDERDPLWWEEVRAEGWGWVDHVEERTEERYGLWYPPLLDAVFQSMGAGFVGTESSTMSLVAQRRVEDWHGGPTATLTWRRS